jgi:hypothetical protein
MSHTKLGPTLSVVDNDKHESHSFWFDTFKCSLKVDRRKDGAALAITLKTAEGKVVISLGSQDCPRFVTQVKHSKGLQQGSEYASQVNLDGVKFKFEYEPPKAG